MQRTFNDSDAAGQAPASRVTVHPLRSLAIMHAAIYDAVNAVDRMQSAYLVDIPVPHASPEAAATEAAHGTLVALYPSQKGMPDTQIAALLALIPDGPGKSQEISVGQKVAPGLRLSQVAFEGAVGKIARQVRLCIDIRRSFSQESQKANLPELPVPCYALRVKTLLHPWSISDWRVQ